MKFFSLCKFDWIDQVFPYDRPFRAKFIPSKIWEDLDDLYTLEEIKNYVKKWKVSIKLQEVPSDLKNVKNYIPIGGEYLPEEKRTILYLCCETFDRSVFTSYSWKRFKLRFIQTLQHEFLHCMQFERRCGEWSTYKIKYQRCNNQKIDVNREYLSRFDEIQAYAHCAYIEFMMKDSSKSVIEHLREIAKTKKCRYSSSIKFYSKTFNNDYTNNPALNKLIKEIFKWEQRYTKYLNQ